MAQMVCTRLRRVVVEPQFISKRRPLSSNRPDCELATAVAVVRRLRGATEATLRSPEIWSMRNRSLWGSGVVVAKEGSDFAFRCIRSGELAATEAEEGTRASCHCRKLSTGCLWEDPVRREPMVIQVMTWSVLSVVREHLTVLSVWVGVTAA